MKRFFQTLLFLCITSFSIQGQTLDFHPSSTANGTAQKVIKFKNIPISGNISDMVTKLQNLGYIFDGMKDGVAVLNGTFLNRNCEIVLYATPISEQMHTITVSSGSKNSWYSLKSEYTEIKNLIKEKYNVTPNKSSEKFYSPYYEGDGYEMQALRNDKCSYFSTFKIGNDKIGVYILEDKVLLLYENSSNKSLNNIEENRKAYLDI